MPKTSAEKQADFRRRKAERGLSEVRGIFAPAELHGKVKDAARKIVKKG